MPERVEEVLLRFPSAPLHGMQRLQEHHVWLGDSENLHSYRVLRSPKRSVQKQKISRIFLMHTGLNERSFLGLYYRIASHLLKEDPNTVCIVRPFPAHLSRFPFQGFAETPLDRYLWDGSHLFRQFLRYMIETQWFLSALARRSSYRYASGANLLAEEDTPSQSRLDQGILAEKMLARYEHLQRQSAESLSTTHEPHEFAPGVSDVPDLDLFERSIESLRSTLNLERDYPGLTADGGGADSEPALHVIGYSLGAFTAQSVFMSWPFMISSCSTLLGGGALRHLAPSAFAHPEEWQTVLHSLRYELDDRLMSDDVGVEKDEKGDIEAIAGIDIELFTFFKRTFYEVFQQDYRGSFQTRLQAFRKRMLFVVGGNDPVVRPERVLASGPPGGMNLLELGGIGHFLQGHAQDRDEEEQRKFWIPEMTSLLSHFADQATDDQRIERRVTRFDSKMAAPVATSEELNALLGEKDGSGKPKSLQDRLAPSELLSISRDGALPGATFERCLDDLLARVKAQAPGEEGVLFMLRNEIPTVLLPDELIRERAAALYHDDVKIVQHCHGVIRRREIIREKIGKICIVLPWNVKILVEKIDLHGGYPSQAETAGGQVLNRISDEKVWKGILKECRTLVEDKNGRESLRKFNGNQPLSELENPVIPEKLLQAAGELSGNEGLDLVPSLPDCWVWASAKALGVYGSDLTIDRAISEMTRIVPDRCCEDKEKKRIWETRLLETLRTDEMRLVTVSRARYNPRFRGRLIATPQGARKLLVHIALTLALSELVTPQNLSTTFEPRLREELQSAA